MVRTRFLTSSALCQSLRGRDVRSAFISGSDFLKNAHLEPDSYQAQTLLTMFRHYNTSDFKGNSSTLSRILGREPKTLREFLGEAFNGE